MRAVSEFQILANCDQKRRHRSYFLIETHSLPPTSLIPFLGNTSFGLGITCSEGWYGYTGALPGYNTANYYSPETGTTIVAWINYQAKEPVEGVASVMVRDIARILTPEHVPFVYKESSEFPKP